MEYPDTGVPLEIRWNKDDPEGRTFTATVCNYGVVDSKGTTFAPGAFTRSLESKMPKAVWSHDWNRPIGQVVAYRDSAERLDVDVKLADFTRVKDADMAHSLLADGVIDEFSFGFSRRTDQPDPKHKGVTMITEADIKEVSPVLVGSVPGTRTLAVRADDGTVDVIEEPIVDPKAELKAIIAEVLAEQGGGQRSEPKAEFRDALTRAADLIESGDTDEAAGLLQLTVDQLLTEGEPTDDQLAERAELDAEIRSDLDLIEGVLGGPF